MALWYLRYGNADYDLHDSEREAADSAVYMEDDCQGIALGIQFPDGRTIARDSWPEFAAAGGRRNEAYEQSRARQAAAEPRPVRKASDPFSGQPVEIEADEPAWLGRQP